jgi:lysophospholipase L1-like esterase
MSKKILATFGDSWPEGAGIGSGRRYGETLAGLMQVDEFCNYGSGGASNEDLLYQFQTFVSQHHDDLGNTTAIFFLTNPARTAHFPRFFSWANADTKLKELYLHFHEPRHEVMRSSSTVSALQHWCAGMGIRDFYFSGWVQYHTWLPGVDLDRIWAKGQETAANWFGLFEHNGEHLVNTKNNPYIGADGAHPNQLGHDMIASRLHGWIESTR